MDCKYPGLVYMDHLFFLLKEGTILRYQIPYSISPKYMHLVKYEVNCLVNLGVLK